MPCRQLSYNGLTRRTWRLKRWALPSNFVERKQVKVLALIATFGKLGICDNAGCSAYALLGQMRPLLGDDDKAELTSTEPAHPLPPLPPPSPHHPLSPALNQP